MAVAVQMPHQQFTYGLPWLQNNCGGMIFAGDRGDDSVHVKILK